MVMIVAPLALMSACDGHGTGLAGQEQTEKAENE
jgi:hypothetical protein